MKQNLCWSSDLSVSVIRSWHSTAVNPCYSHTLYSDKLNLAIFLPSTELIPHTNIDIRPIDTRSIVYFLSIYRYSKGQDTNNILKFGVEFLAILGCRLDKNNQRCLA